MFPYGSEGKDIFARPNCASSSQSKWYCVCWIFIIEPFVLLSRWNARELSSSLPFHVLLVLFSLSSSQLKKVLCFAFKSKFAPKNHNNRPVIPSTTTNTHDRQCTTRNSIARHVSLKKKKKKVILVNKQTNKQKPAISQIKRLLGFGSSSVGSESDLRAMRRTSKSCLIPVVPSLSRFHT